MSMKIIHLMSTEQLKQKRARELSHFSGFVTLASVASASTLCLLGITNGWTSEIRNMTLGTLSLAGFAGLVSDVSGRKGEKQKDEIESWVDEVLENQLILQNSIDRLKDELSELQESQSQLLESIREQRDEIQSLIEDLSDR